MMIRRGLGLVVVVAVSVGMWAADDGSKSIDTEKSTVTVRVYKTGLFSAFAHDHEISAPIQQGSFVEGKAAVEFSVDARKMKVVDKDVSDSDRAKIQATMLGPTVLDSEKFPEIRFHSTQVEPRGEGKWLVHGDLTIHGQTKPVAVNVEGKNGHYRGRAELKQTDFGITPVSIGGGAVKVKNELRVEFDVAAKGN